MKKTTNPHFCDQSNFIISHVTMSHRDMGNISGNRTHMANEKLSLTMPSLVVDVCELRWCPTVSTRGEGFIERPSIQKRIESLEEENKHVLEREKSVVSRPQ